jgi:hypothetical protein
MNSPTRLIILLLATGLMACHKTSTPIQADMDAESRQKAVEVREAADREAAALKEAAASKEAARKEAAAKEILAPGSTVPASTPPVPSPTK